MLVGGRYETIRELGRGGGFGKTYLAEDTYRRGRPKCVVKKIQPLSKTPSVLQQARELFQAEAEALHQLGNYDQIPKLFDHLEQGNDFFLVQELVDGHDLRQAFTLGDRWDEKNLVSLLREVLEILAIVHQHNIIHQDVKPQNLIRRWLDKKLVLIDFSSIKAIRSLTVTPDGEPIITQPIGTPGYIAKEQMEGQPKRCSDIYAVGMMGIQAVTGYMPNQLPRHPDTQEVQWHDLAQVTPELTAILDKMVRVDPQDRYQSATEVLEALPAPVIVRAIAIPEEELPEEPKPPSYDIVISPKFAWVKDFSEGLAPVVVEDYLGYIDAHGEFVIQPELDFDLASGFREGVYQFSGGLAQLPIAYKWGYIDRTGKLAIHPRFDGAELFANGLARVELKQYYGYIDPTGEMVIEPQFESAAQAFHEELAGVEIDHKYGYINKSGKIVIPPQFDSADAFGEGLARVTLNDKYGFINKAGELVIPAEFDVAHTFNEGLARVRMDGRYGYIDKSGKLVIDPQFDDTFSFTEGLALVRNEEHYGYINPSGETVIALQFEDAYPFACGLAAVRVEGQWGYINKTGEFVIEPQFEDVRAFHGDRAAIKLGNQWGYLGVKR
ncbi:WG repeat-containing protein [Oscillatoria sp. FACHB-1407]|uniref:WG repeat-containing protein n=1 Tax=Oscillatoria sp. FACHB-1407 TaxID=2692847 RepID=UPI001686B5EB|nr:WG repeat-containing protein [Oscillatoria sp. FACHB-1407]MBD2464303.1 WG repeat-containing protein [Oscillatoria sp. FACHB-1407]